MMKFKNQYTETKDMNRTRCCVAESAIALSLFYVLFMFFAWNNDNYGMMIFWALLAFVTWIESSSSIDKWEKHYDEKPIKNPEITLEFYDDKMLISENNAEFISRSYLEIQDVEEKSDSFILFFNFDQKEESKFTVKVISDKDMGESTLLVPKSTFIFGEAKEFKKFIKARKQKGFVFH